MDRLLFRRRVRAVSDGKQRKFFVDDDGMLLCCSFVVCGALALLIFELRRANCRCRFLFSSVEKHFCKKIGI